METDLGDNPHKGPESREGILDAEDHLGLVTLLARLAVINRVGILELGLKRRISRRRSGV